MTRRRFTVDEFNRIAETGVFDEGSRVELIDGEIIEMAAYNDPHVVCVLLFTRFLGRRLGEHYDVSVQNPIRLDNGTEPLPDIAIIPIPPTGKPRGIPSASDVLLVIEVSDTTLVYDQTVKLPRYARSGIPETWIVDIKRRVVEVHRRPTPRGYEEHAVYGPGSTLVPSAFPHVLLTVDEILP